MAKLLVHESAGVREFEIVDNEVHMGRELDNTLRLPDPSISRHHCVVRKVGGGFEIQDLQSSNGVLVNGNRIQTSPLHDGDRITLGQIQLTFQDPQLDPSSTVALHVGAPAMPAGTMRMSAKELAAIHGAPPPGATAEVAVPTQNQFATDPVQMVPDGPKPPVPPVVPPPATGLPPAPAQTSFLGSLLPTVPDSAIPTGERGDFLTRLLAAVIDYAPLIALQILAALFIPASLAGGLSAGLGAMAALGCLSFLLLVAYLIFVPWCWIKFGATPGKKIMKLRVVPEANPLGRIDLGTAALRMVGYLVNGIIAWVITMPFAAIFVVGAVTTGSFGASALVMKLVSLVANVIPYLLILLTADRKGLHDMMAKTIVVKVDR